MKKLALILTLVAALLVPGAYLSADCSSSASGCGFDVTAVGEGEGLDCDCISGPGYVGCSVFDEDGEGIAVIIIC